MTATDPAPDLLATVNNRGEVVELVTCDDDTIRAIADAIVRNEKHRASTAALREARKYRRRQKASA